jgi:hypothetical protein
VKGVLVFEDEELIRMIYELELSEEELRSGLLRRRLKVAGTEIREPKPDLSYGTKGHWALGVNTLVVFGLLLNEVNHVETSKSSD